MHIDNNQVANPKLPPKVADAVKKARRLIANLNGEIEILVQSKAARSKELKQLIKSIESKGVEVKNLQKKIDDMAAEACEVLLDLDANKDVLAKLKKNIEKGDKELTEKWADYERKADELKIEAERLQKFGTALDTQAAKLEQDKADLAAKMDKLKDIIE